MTDADQPIDLMSASLEEIQTLHGFGETTAKKIITMRSLMGTLSIQLLSTILGFPTAALQTHLHSGKIETLPGDKNRTTEENLQLPKPSKEPRDHTVDNVVDKYHSLILSEKKETESLRQQLKTAECDARRYREREMLLLRERDKMSAALDTHRGKTSQSRHLTSTPQHVKPMVPHRVYKQPTSVREEPPTKSWHPYYQDKHSSTTQTRSQNNETAISRSWRADRETRQDKTIDTWKHSSFQEVNSFSTQSDEHSSSIPSSIPRKKDLISPSDQEAPRTDERSHSGQSTNPAVEERPHNRPSSRPGSGDTHLASSLDEIIEDPEQSSAQQYNTLVDTRPPEDDGENYSPTVSNNAGESMAAQNEIAFPTTMEVTSTPETKEISEDHETDKESLGPADCGLDLEDEVEPVYEPPENDVTLPDLCCLMVSLAEGIPPDDSPINKNDPPALFSRPENIDNYKNITDLRLQTEKVEIEDYVRVFERGNKDDMLMIGSIGLEVVQEEERRLQEKHVTYWESEAFWEEDRKWRIQIFDVQAKRRAAYAIWQERKEIQCMDKLQQQKERLTLDPLERSFRSSENQLILELKTRRGELMTYYDDLVTADGHYGRSRGHRWKVDWERTQPIQVKLTCSPGVKVKDKIPGGRYVLIVSLYDCLGGHVMRGLNLKGQQWGGATLPIWHDGQFYDMAMPFDQSVFTVLPPRPGIKPGMILMFELLLLRGELLSSDMVVAWGTSPIADGQLDIIGGNFNCPMLHGEMDHHVEKHEKLVFVIAIDFDRWMCNLYFEIVKLPRFLAGHKEYEVQLQFSSGILAYPDCENTDEARHDGEDPVALSLSHLYTDTTANTSKIASDATVGSSVSILIIDYNLKRYENQTGTYPRADGAKLYWHVYHVESTGLAGIFIMLFIYVFTCFMTCALLCMYFIRFHNNGRMVDIYGHLHGDEDISIVPYDLEVSHQELAYIVKKAKQVRGVEGESHIVAVYDYIWEDELVEETVWDADGVEMRCTKDSKDITTSVAIHTLHLDGLQELYRHFLRLTDCAIIEVFGDLTVAGMNEDINDDGSKEPYHHLLVLHRIDDQLQTYEDLYLHSQIFPIMDTYLRRSRTLDTGEKQVPTKNTNLRHSRPSATVTRPAQSERSFSLGDSHVWKRSPSPYGDSSHQDQHSLTFPTQSGSRGGMSSSVEGFRSSVFVGPAHREPMRGRYTRVVGSRLVVSLDRDNTYSQGGMSSRAEGSHLGVSRVAGRPRGPRGGRSYSLEGFQQQIPAKDLSTNAQPLAQLTLNNARCFCRLWAGY